LKENIAIVFKHLSQKDIDTWLGIVELRPTADFVIFLANSSASFMRDWQN